LAGAGKPRPYREFYESPLFLKISPHRNLKIELIIHHTNWTNFLITQPKNSAIDLNIESVISSPAITLLLYFCPFAEDVKKVKTIAKLAVSIFIHGIVANFAFAVPVATG
jgi:hypothetical protein